VIDVLTNGDEDERLEFSFRLFKENDNLRTLSFDEFNSFLVKIIAQWCIMSTSTFKINQQ
jgi:hypothetical protein